MHRLWLASFVVSAAACNPPAVDPDATFVVRGSLQDLSGTKSANTKVRIYKTDVTWDAQQNFLQFFDIGEGIDSNAVYETESASDGTFSLQLRGSEVNTDGGGGAAYLTAVYQDGGDLDATLAVASDWFYFRDVDPEIDVGELELWDGGDAAQLGTSITFGWTGDDAPSGRERDSTLPTFLFAYNGGASELQWAAHTFSTQVNVPAAAFEGADAPEYFLTTFTKKSGSSQLTQHRSDIHSVLAYNDQPRTNHMASSGVRFFDGSGTEIDLDAAKDRDVTTPSFLMGEAIDRQELFIDLGQVRTYSEILIYNLGVMYLSDARVTLDVSAQDENDLANVDFTSNALTAEGAEEYERWLYLAEDDDGSARWLHLWVERMSVAGATPYFDWIGEFAVLD